MHRKRSTYKVFSNRFLGVCPSWLYLLIAAGFCLCLWQYLRQQLHLWLWILFFFFTFLSPFVLSALVLDLSGFYLSGLAALASIGFVGLLQELISTKDFSTFAEFSFS
jgi:hypothetical protein